MFRLSILLLGVLTSLAQAQKLSEEETRDGFFPLFNGKDFSGWRLSDNSASAPNWKVEEGLLRVTGGGKPNIATQWDFEDFEIRFEWRANKDKYNSGFFVRSGRNVGSNQLNLAKGSEGNFIGGKIVGGGKGVPELQKPAGEWNEWRLIAVGDKLTFSCNGKPAWEGTGLKDRRGHIGFQAEGAPIDFRNVRIREFDTTSLMTAKKWEEGKSGWKWEEDLLLGEKGDMLRTKTSSSFVFRTEWKAEKDSTAEIRIGTNIIHLGDISSGTTIKGAKAAKKNDSPVGEWNYLEIRATKGKLTLRQNGQELLTDISLEGEGTGVALSVTSGKLQFRGLRLREIR